MVAVLKYRMFRPTTPPLPSHQKNTSCLYPRHVLCSLCVLARVCNNFMSNNPFLLLVPSLAHTRLSTSKTGFLRKKDQKKEK